MAILVHSQNLGSMFTNRLKRKLPPESKFVFGGQDSEVALRAMLNALLGYTGSQSIVK